MRNVVHDWLTSWSKRKKGQGGIGSSTTRFQPILEELESRCVLSSTTATLDYHSVPLSFEANQGQVDDSVAFLSRGEGYSVYLTKSEAVVVLQQPDTGDSITAAPPNSAVVKFRFAGANIAPSIQGEGQLPGTSNYLIGSDAQQWITNIPTFEKVIYADIYHGVDVVYYGNQRQLEFDFVVAPGISPDAIALEIDGSTSLEINESGELLIDTGGGVLVQQAPVVYQEIDGVRRLVDGEYVLQGDNRIGFRIGEYDVAHSLTIDPVLAYSTYLGGSTDENAHGVAVDEDGNAYVTGFTDSLNFPTRNSQQDRLAGNTDVFVTKLSVTGRTILYSTYIGGGGDDAARSIRLDPSNNAYVVGATASFDFPTLNPLVVDGQVVGNQLNGDQDAFVFKLNPQGNGLEYSTYLGGNREDIGWDLAVDPAALTVVVTGETRSTTFPVERPLIADGKVVGDLLRGANDAFVTKLNQAGNGLIFSTYLGGSGNEEGLGIAQDSSDRAVYITGLTNSNNFPVTKGAPFEKGRAGTDAFVAKITSSGDTLAYSTYLPGSKDDAGFSIAVDDLSNAYVVGETSSANFPTRSAIILNGQNIGDNLRGSSDAFVAKLNTAATGLGSIVYATYLGGDGAEQGRSIAINEDGNAFVTGATTSANFPTRNPLPNTQQQQQDAFVAQLSPSGRTLNFSTYLGGEKNDAGFGIAVDSFDSLFVVGQTESSKFPTRNSIIHNKMPIGSALQGDTDGFVVQIRLGGQGGNAKPLANDDVVSVAANTSSPIDVLRNDDDPNGLVLRIDTVVRSPRHGTATINDAGTPADYSDDYIIYTPAPDFIGTDRFKYRVRDEDGKRDTATVFITVRSASDLPQAVDDAYFMAEDESLNVLAPGVLGNDTDPDGDPLTVVLVDGPANGILILDDDGSFTYTPNADFHGTDSFTYQANDGLADSNMATVRITVNPVAETTTTTLTSSSSITITNVPVLLTATVGSASGTPTGSVQFLVDGFAYGGPVALFGGSASIELNGLFVGQYTVTAEYSGDGDFAASVGAAVQSVSPAPTEVRVTSFMNPAEYGGSGTLLGTV